jgi:hypothetical protein
MGAPAGKEWGELQCVPGPIAHLTSSLLRATQLIPVAQLTAQVPWVDPTIMFPFERHIFWVNVWTT